MDSWTKIQSGSIYYALSKLEKEGLIELKNVVGIGAKARKVYCITQSGISTLNLLVKEMLHTEINEIGSDKFIIYPLLKMLDKVTMINELQVHIKKLKEKKAYLEKWRDIKVNPMTLKVEKIAFEMLISNLEYQIQWHLSLIDEMDACIVTSENVSKLIAAFDFSDAGDFDINNAAQIEKFKYAILRHSDESLNQYMDAFKK